MKTKLEVLIYRSLEFLFKNDQYLISHKPVNTDNRADKNHVGERAIMFRFAHYMQMLMYMDPFFSKYSLDCEYNRNMDAIKALPSSENDVYPDIVIHERGSNKNNYAVIEIKTYWNANQDLDRKKISDFMNPEGVYKYKNGALILLDKSRNETIVEMLLSKQIES